MSYIGNSSTQQTYAPAVDYFNGDGSTVAFTLSRPLLSVAQMVVVVANVIQNPGSAFTVNGTTITFTSAPPSGTNNVWVEYVSPNTQTIAPSFGTVSKNELMNQNAATGGGTDQVFYLNGQTINFDYTVPSGYNAGTFGDITIATGVTVTVATGSDWVMA